MKKATNNDGKEEITILADGKEASLHKTSSMEDRSSHQCSTRCRCTTAHLPIEAGILDTSMGHHCGGVVHHNGGVISTPPTPHNVNRVLQITMKTGGVVRPSKDYILLKAIRGGLGWKLLRQIQSQDVLC